MSQNKKYYWLKLNENFFEDDTIEWIEEQENGERYVLFYLKLCLKSLKEEGNLIRYVGEKLIPYDIKALSKLTNTDQDTVAVSLKVFEEIGLIERKDTGEIYMKQIDEMIGSETEVAKRVRKHRAKQAMLQSNIDVTKSNTEIEIEIRDRDKDIETEVEDEETTTSTLNKNNINLILKEWNQLGLQNLRNINSNTKRHTMLKARIKEYSLNEVIEAIRSVSKSPFLKGQNDRNWTITFDWLVRPNNFLKVIEGNYLDKEVLPNGSNRTGYKGKAPGTTTQDAEIKGITRL